MRGLGAGKTACCTRFRTFFIDDNPFEPSGGRGVWTDPYTGLAGGDVEKAMFKLRYQKDKGADCAIPPAFIQFKQNMASRLQL